ncbi:hypothetical protein Ahy_A06g030328 [Arachis hypogaea]|uniref:Uncharacterized protein n=1 Tax=Arachis hypogaea TaxID=3818 RepID=A0A445CVX6_ARAHY|nr:hypothetical protein Ahy_A06g030328 [Arachis hypogaea]
MPITDKVSMRNMFQIHRQTQMRHPQIELYVECETVEAVAVQNDIDIDDDRAAVYKGMNSDSEEDFEATYEGGNEDEDGDVGVEATAENVVVHPWSSQPMYVPPFMRELDLDAMHAPEFSEYANIGDPETWPAYEGPTMVANPALRRTSKGRPKLTRYLNEMDSRDMRGPRICRLCGAQVHSRSRCPQHARPSGAGDDDGS